MISDVVVSPVRDAADLEACLALRLAVFVDEQNVPLAEEIDAADRDGVTVHLIARDGSGNVVGTARVLPGHPGRAHVGRVAVVRAARGTGVGTALMTACETVALGRLGVHGTVQVELSAQEHAFGFYRRAGYEIYGPRYLDAGIWHRNARKQVRAPDVGGGA
ncbi:MAG: GNAT family N-acetyltransferase [Cellulomonadaceae bacterium]